MKTFTSNQLHHLESSRSVPIAIMNQKEIIFRNIKDIVLLHERLHTLHTKQQELVYWTST